ncbi:hypothetical protein Tco_1153706 [Tanacetum coccineum]
MQSKPTEPKAASKKPKPAPAKPQEKKRKPVSESSEAPLLAVLEESLTDAYPTRRGPLPPVVFREPDTGKLQPLPEVQGKGKEKRHTPVPSELASHEESSSLYAKLGLYGSDTESDEQMPSVVRSGAQDEGQAGPDPGTLDEGQDGPNPDGDWVCCNPNLSTPSAAYPDVQENLKLTVDEQVIPEEPVSSTGPIVHLCLPPMTSPVIGPVPRPDSPNVHWPLPTTTTTTAAQQQTTLPLPPSNHTREAAVGVLLFHRRLGSERSNDSVIGCGYSYQYACIERVLFRARFKDSPTSDMMGNSAPTMLEEDYDKGHANHRVPIQGRLDTGASDSAQAPPPPPPSLSTHQGDQSTSTAAPSSSKTAASAEYSAWTTTDTRVKPSITTIPDDLYMDDETTADEQAYSSGDEVGHDHIPTVNLRRSWWKPLTEDRPATPEPTWTIPSSDLTMPTNNWASALKSTYTPPPEKSLLAQTGDMAIFVDWYCKQQGITHLTLRDLEGPAFEIVKVFHPEVIHLQFQMEECHKLLTDQVDDTILRYNISKPLSLGGEPGHVTIQPDFFFNKDLEYLRYGRKVSRPALTISKMKAAYYPDVGLEQLVPDQFWIEEECKYDIAAMYGISHWWFQRQRFYIDRFSSEGDRRAVRTHMRILSVVRIEVFSMYGYNYMKKIVLRRADLKEYVIAERDFKYMYPSDFEDLYLLNLQGHLNHLSPDDKKVLTTVINLWTRNLVIRQWVEDLQLGIESYQTQLNLTKPRWDATEFEFKPDYTVIDSPRAVTFRDKYGVQMMMRFNEIHKFSDGTLQQIDEALDYRVKEFRVNRINPGMNTRFWTKKDVVRSKEFMFAIQKRLKTRRIF